MTSSVTTCQSERMPLPNVDALLICKCCPWPELHKQRCNSCTADCRLLKATVAAGKLVHKSNVYSEEVVIKHINNMGIILLTFFSIMHGQDNWRGQYVAQKHGDHTAWDADFVFGLLEEFFEITGAFSLLDMQEEQQRNDKVQN